VKNNEFCGVGAQNKAGVTSMKAKNKLKIKIAGRPPKIRRVWKLKPVARVKTSDKAQLSDRIHARELREYT
jgi:hypothetical protein